jgi:hypothetical protein
VGRVEIVRASAVETGKKHVEAATRCLIMSL